MALSLKWDAAFESRPPTGLNRNQLDNEMRFMRDMTRQVMFQEHNFGPGTPDDGRHRPGQVTLFDVGDITNRNNLTDVPDGALYLLYKGPDDYELQGYRAATTSWITLAYPDHSQLSNLLNVNAHPEFLLKSGGTLSRPVNALNAGIHVPGAGVSKYGYLTSEHFEAGHPNTVRDIIDNTETVIPLSKLKKYHINVTLSMTARPLDGNTWSVWLPVESYTIDSIATVTGDTIPVGHNYVVNITSQSFSSGGVYCNNSTDFVEFSTIHNPVFGTDSVEAPRQFFCFVNVIKLPIKSGVEGTLLLTVTAGSNWRVTEGSVTFGVDVYGAP